MAEPVMSDQVGVRFGISEGLLFTLTGFVVADGLSGAYGVAMLLAATTLLSPVLDGRHALLLGVSGWAFATGFAVNTLGALTMRPNDLLRLAVFLIAAAAAALRQGGGTR
jgi:hypothetical protein